MPSFGWPREMGPFVRGEQKLLQVPGVCEERVRRRQPFAGKRATHSLSAVGSSHSCIIKVSDPLFAI